MSYKLVELQQLAAALETSAEGTAATLNAAAAGFLVRNTKFTYGIPRYEKKTRRASFSKFPSVGGSRMGTIEFEMDLLGLPGSATAPGYEIFLQACGTLKAATTSPTANAFTYTALSVWDAATPAATETYSLTIGAYIDGGLRKIVGARGNCVLSAKSGEPIVAKFTFSGALVDYAESAMLTGISYQTGHATPPLFYNASMSVGGLSTSELVVDTFELDFGNVVQMRADANSATGYRSAAIVDRDARFKFDPEMTSIADHSFYALWKAETTAALSLSITGSNDTTNNKITITAPALQYEDVQDGERGQLWIKDIGAALRGSAAAGDDEFVIKLGT